MQSTQEDTLCSREGDWAAQTSVPRSSWRGALNPEKTCKIVSVCALLHNICKQRNIPLPINEEDELLDGAPEANLDEAAMNPDPDRPAGRNGHPFRDYIANLHYRYVLIYCCIL